MSDDWARGEEWDTFVKHVRENTMRGMLESAFVMSIAPGENFDVKYAVELGMGILLDKPLLMIVLPGREVPERLARVADRICHADIDTEEGRRVIAKAVKAFKTEFGLE